MKARVLLDQSIIDLCTKVIATQDSDEFQAAVEELREALNRRISSARDKVAELAQVIADVSDSKAA